MSARPRALAWLASRPLDDGVTIVELLTAMAILGIMLTTISLSISEGLSNTSSAKTTLAGSNLVQFTARYFDPDVQSAPGAVELTGSACGTGTTVLRVPAGDGTTNVIAYVTSTAGPETALVRRVCNAGGTLLATHTLGTSKAALSAVATCLPDTTTCRTVTLTLSVAGGAPVVLRADRRAS
ncbi:MAG: prepilin-type N-terminal cleavage/methylation domain-containing protein [Acidimicrobiia bacterium]